MAAFTPITYAEFYHVVTNDPHEGDLSAVYEDETPVPIVGIQPTPANIVSAVCGDSNPDAYLLFLRGGDGVSYARVLLQVIMCPLSRERAPIFAGAPTHSLRTFGSWDLPLCAFRTRPFTPRRQWCRLSPITSTTD